MSPSMPSFPPSLLVRSASASDGHRNGCGMAGVASPYTSDQLRYLRATSARVSVSVSTRVLKRREVPDGVASSLRATGVPSPRCRCRAACPLPPSRSSRHPRASSTTSETLSRRPTSPPQPLHHSASHRRHQCTPTAALSLGTTPLPAQSVACLPA
mmetsp:Transcript_26910/g.77253  ORF Transcript_26910/g.77253 Transcript_26910/m.77253 type:complete len:156 (+) Transcript_26910:584-1051(+)